MPDARGYLVRYQDAAGATLTGFTVRSVAELRATAGEIAARPEITLTWRPWSMTDPGPWRTVAEIPPAPPEPRRLWVHSGPCIYCAHGPLCTSLETSCEATASPHYGADGTYPGPVCRACGEEIKRAEIAADPYYRGDNYAMFGDDE